MSYFVITKRATGPDVLIIDHTAADPAWLREALIGVGRLLPTEEAYLVQARDEADALRQLRDNTPQVRRVN